MSFNPTQIFLHTLCFDNSSYCKFIRRTDSETLSLSIILIKCSKFSLFITNIIYKPSLDRYDAKFEAGLNLRIEKNNSDFCSNALT